MVTDEDIQLLALASLGIDISKNVSGMEDFYPKWYGQLSSEDKAIIDRFRYYRYETTSAALKALNDRGI